MTRWLAVLAALAVGCGSVTADSLPSDGGQGSAAGGGSTGSAGRLGTVAGGAGKSGGAGTGGDSGSIGAAGAAGTSGSAGTTGAGNTAGAGNTTGAAGTSPPATCPRAGQMYCSGLCQSILTDPDNCGACGRACASGTCSNGVCAGSGAGGAGNTTGTGSTTGAGNSTGTGNSTGSGNSTGTGNTTGTGGVPACPDQTVANSVQGCLNASQNLLHKSGYDCWICPDGRPTECWITNAPGLGDPGDKGLCVAKCSECS